MKKFMKFLAAVCMMVFMCGVAVSADETAITPTVITKGSENPTALQMQTYVYSQSNIVTIGSKSCYGVMIPVTIQESGVLHLYFGDNQNLTEQVQVLVLPNNTTTSGYGRTFYETADLKNQTVSANVQAGTVYVLLNSYAANCTLTTNTVSFSAALVGNSSYGTVPTSVTGKTSASTTVNLYDAYYTSGYNDIYIKYQPKSTGYLTVTGKSGTGYVTLCKSNKKELSTQDYLNPDNDSYKKVSYGVKKGTTYYIKTKSYSDMFSLNLKLTKVSDKSGSSRKKAKSISANNTYKGTITAGSSTKDWYKIVLKKSSKVTITVKGATNDAFKVTYFEGTRSMGSRSLYDIFSNKVQSTNSLNYNSRAKWTKGTYYIKIERANSKSSGYYTVKWQKK